DSQGSEDREALAHLAANAEDAGSADSEAYIEKYLRSVLAVENILTLDRLRQEVAVKEHLSVKGKLHRRSLSSPNVHRLSGSRQDLGGQQSLANNRGRWESQQDVSQSSPHPSRSRGTSPRRSENASPAHNQSQDQGQDSMTSSYLNPVKAFVPQMPKIFKTLFPQRDEKGRQSATPLAPQPVPRIIVQSASIDDAAFRPKAVAPEERTPIRQPVIARSPTQEHKNEKSSTVPSQPKPCESPVQDSQEGPPSPVSEASSGYFSHSVSTATLSEALITGNEVPSGQTLSPTATDISPPGIPSAQASSERESTSKMAAIPGGVHHKADVGLQEDIPAGHTNVKHVNDFVGSVLVDHSKPSLEDHVRKPDVLHLASLEAHHTKATSKSVPSPEKITTSTLSSENQGDAQPVLTAEHLNPTKGAVSPFRIQKVRPSELKSFTRMLGDELGDVPSSEKTGSAVKLKGLDDPVESGEDKNG
ncbi:kinesin-like protein KIF13B, partial [Mantella aurantiaca]